MTAKIEITIQIGSEIQTTSRILSDDIEEIQRFKSGQLSDIPLATSRQMVKAGQAAIYAAFTELEKL